MEKDDKFDEKLYYDEMKCGIKLHDDDDDVEKSISIIACDDYSFFFITLSSISS